MRDVSRIVLPPASYAQEKEKIEKRWPAAVRFIQEHGLNEFFDGDAARYRHRHAGRHVQHRLRALEVLGLADTSEKAASRSTSSTSPIP